MASNPLLHAGMYVSPSHHRIEPAGVCCLRQCVRAMLQQQRQRFTRLCFRVNSITSCRWLYTFASCCNLVPPVAFLISLDTVEHTPKVSLMCGCFRNDKLGYQFS